MSSLFRQQQREQIKAKETISDTLNTHLTNQNILAEVARQTNTNTEEEAIENQGKMEDLLVDMVNSSNLKGDAYNSSRKLKQEIENINEEITDIEEYIARATQIAENSPVPRTQNKYLKAIEESEQEITRLTALKNVKKQEFSSAFIADQTTVDNAVINSEYLRSIENNISNSNTGNVVNNISNKNDTQPQGDQEWQYNPNDILFNQGPTSEDLATLNAAFLDFLNPSKTSITPSAPKYQPDNFLLGGGQWLYDTIFEKAKSQGEKPLEAFLKDSDTIREDLEEISSNPEIMALVEIAAQNGIKTDEQMLSLIFDSVYFDHDRFTPNNFKVSANKTLTGIQHIKDGEFDTEEAKRIINRLGLKNNKKQLANTLIFATGGR